MSPTPRSHNRSSGFSLIEALAALAIAAVLTAALTRLIVATRASAARVGETTKMAALSETLMARVASSPGLRPGRTDGRRGSYVWHIEVAPVSFTAVARARAERKPPDAGRVEASGAFPEAPAAPGLGAGTDASQAPSSPATRWVTYRVAVVVQAPSGSTYAVDTIRLGSEPEPDER